MGVQCTSSMQNFDKVTNMCNTCEHEELHSGQFMVSHLDDDSGQTQDDTHTQTMKHETLVGQSPPSVLQKPSRHSGVDDSLAELMQCLSIAYPGKITNPKWNKFSGICFSLRDKIRLNNLIWREYHMQYVMKKRSLVVSFSMPFTDNARKPQVVIMEGKYWKKRVEIVRKEYQRFREEKSLLLRFNPSSRKVKDSPSDCVNMSPLLMSNISGMNELESLALPTPDDSDFLMDLDIFCDQYNNAVMTPAEYIQPTNSTMKLNEPQEIMRSDQDEYNDLFVKSSFLGSLSPTLFEQHFDQIFGIDSDSAKSQSSSQMKREIIEKSVDCESSLTLPDSKLDNFFIPDDISDFITSSSPNKSAPNTVKSLFTEYSNSGTYLEELSEATNEPVSYYSNQPVPSYISSSQNFDNSFIARSDFSIPQSTSRVTGPDSEGLLPTLLRSHVNAVSHSLREGYSSPTYDLQSTQYKPLTYSNNQTVSSHQNYMRGSSYPATNHSITGDPYPIYSTQPVITAAPYSHTPSMETVGGFTSPSSTVLDSYQEYQNTNKSPPTIIRKKSTGSSFKTPSDKRKSLEFNLPKDHSPRLNTLPYSSRRRSSQPNVQVPQLTHPEGSSSPPCGSSSYSTDNVFVSQIHDGHKVTSRSTPLLTRLISNNQGAMKPISTSPLTRGGVSYNYSTQIDKTPFSNATTSRKYSSNTQQQKSQLFATNSNSNRSPNGKKESKVKQRRSSVEASYPLYTKPQQIYTAQPDCHIPQPEVTKYQSQWSMPANSYLPKQINFSVTKSSPCTSYQPSIPSSSSARQHKVVLQSSSRFLAESNDADSKRRYSIKSGLDLLHSMLPTFANSSNSVVSSANFTHNTKMATASLLKRTADLIRQLKQEKRVLEDEEAKLRQEFQMLQNSINSSCSRLPATGVDMSGPKISQAKQWFDEYVRISTLNNWKFYIFSLIIGDLFHEYNATVSIASFDQLTRSIFVWLEQHASLVKLRPVILRAMRTLSTATSILTEPGRLPQQAYQAVSNKIKSSHDDHLPSAAPQDIKDATMIMSLTNGNGFSAVVPKSCTKR